MICPTGTFRAKNHGFGIGRIRFPETFIKNDGNKMTENIVKRPGRSASGGCALK
jgi:hypothetical protein